MIYDDNDDDDDGLSAPCEQKKDVIPSWTLQIERVGPFA
jgi:hypothetical protein